MSQKPNLVNMDFNGIKDSLKEFMRKQDEFKDYNFEGSGLNVLLDVLAFNSMNNAYLANMLANESEIDSAIIRANVVSRAKLLGYTPKSTTASRAVLSVSINGPTNGQSSLLMPRGTRFVVKSDKTQHVFLTLKEYNLRPDASGVYKHDAIEVFEGTLKAYSFDVDNTERRYVIPSTNIDTSTLKVAVYPDQTSNDYEEFVHSNTIINVTKDSPVFWTYETDNGLHEIRFGNGVFGKRPQVGSVVYAEYLETNGSVANGLSRFSLVGSFEGFENADITIKTVVESDGGAEPESTSSIKINAPRFFQSQGRAVTKEDYVTVVKDIYPQAKSVAVWGGEEVTPPRFGKVLVSIIPMNNGVLTSSNKRELQRKLKDRGVIGIEPVIIDPKFINMNLTVVATVRGGQTLPALHSTIRSRVNTFFDAFGSFDQDFHYSNLVADIKSIRGVAGVNVDVLLSIKPVIGDNVVVNFENAIRKGSIRSSRIDGTSIKDVEGKILLGTKVIGTVDYLKGSITIDPKGLNLDGLEVFGQAEELDIYAGKGSALRLNEQRLSIDLRT